MGSLLQVTRVGWEWILWFDLAAKAKYSMGCWRYFHFWISLVYRMCRVACGVSLQERRSGMSLWWACNGMARMHDGWCDDGKWVAHDKVAAGLGNLFVCSFVLILDKAVPCQGQDLNRGIMVSLYLESWLQPMV